MQPERFMPMCWGAFEAYLAMVDNRLILSSVNA